MPADRILLGVIGRPHGVHGLVHVTSHTADPADLTAYGPLSDDRGRCFTLHWRGEGVVEVAEQVDGAAIKVTDRRAAEKLTNTRLYVARSALPVPEEDEFYLADLVGLGAMDASGTRIGTVTAVHDYGAGASLELARPDAPSLLVPFTRAAVPVVDLSEGRVIVDENIVREAEDVEVPSSEAEPPAGRAAASRNPASRRRNTDKRPRSPQPARPSPGARRAPASPSSGRGAR
jgi:16S rRNA processing protein RimM